MLCLGFKGERGAVGFSRWPNIVEAYYVSQIILLRGGPERALGRQRGILNATEHGMPQWMGPGPRSVFALVGLTQVTTAIYFGNFYFSRFEAHSRHGMHTKYFEIDKNIFVSEIGNTRRTSVKYI